MRSRKVPGLVWTAAACLGGWALEARLVPEWPTDPPLTHWTESALTPHGTSVLLLITALGNFPWATLLTLGSGVWWAWGEHYAWAWACLRVPVAMGVADLLKSLVQQPRPGPAWVVQGPWASGYGWPSGHAAFAMALGVLWIRYIKIGVVRLALGTLIFVVAVSRVALGLHWPGQVAAGLLLGALFAALPIPGRIP